MARARRPSPITLELMSMPPSSQFGYNFPWNNNTNTYDTSSYNPAFSDNRVSLQDVHTLMSDLQSQPLFPPSVCDPWCYGMIAVFAIFAVTMIFTSTGSAIRSGSFGSMMLVFLACMVSYVGILCKVNINAEKRSVERKAQLESVLAKHQQTTFAGKEVFLQMSTLCSYISIMFSFRAAGPAGAYVGQNSAALPFPPNYPAHPQYQFAFDQQAPYTGTVEQHQQNTLSAPLF